MNRRHIHLPAFALLLVTMIWGSGFIATEYAIRSGMPTAWIMMIRLWVGSGVIGLCFFRRIFPLKKVVLLHGATAGAILFGAFYAQTAGQGQTNVSNAAFLTATNVIMIPFLLWLFQKKRPSARIFLLSLITMAGVILLTMQGGFRLSLGPGDLLVLLCAFLFALHITWLDIGCSRDDSLQIAFVQLLAAGMCGALMLLITRPPITAEQLQDGLLPVLYLGVFSTGICYFLQTWAQKHIRASEAGIILSAEGLFGTLFSLLLGLESFRWSMALGGLIITGTVILAGQPNEKTFPWRKKRRTVL